MGYPQPLKKNEMMPCAVTRMDLQMITPSEASRKQTDKHHMTSLTRDSEELICRAETDTENKLRLPKGTGVEAINKQFEMNRYTLVHIK